MFSCKRILCIGTIVLGLILVGLGAFLLATGFAIDAITIGVIVAGILLLVIGCLGKCLKIPGLLCFLLTLITLFLIITGILAILLVGSLVIGLILIGLGVLTLLFTVICLINTCCCPNYDRHGAPC
ncbi:MAG: hypothetical protein GX236_04395 [Clostridiaceae bacterium]|nr:hypothetical protein [Clostridiaceae bacterium]